jgi:hypothetical protein
MNFSNKTPKVGKRIGLSVQELSTEIKVRIAHELMSFGTVIQLHVCKGQALLRMAEGWKGVGREVCGGVMRDGTNWKVCFTGACQGDT